jgi:hypothetical protein
VKIGLLAFLNTHFNKLKNMKTLKKKSFRLLLSKINMKKLILLLLLTSVKISAQTLITPSNIEIMPKGYS